MFCAIFTQIGGTFSKFSPDISQKYHQIVSSEDRAKNCLKMDEILLEM